MKRSSFTPKPPKPKRCKHCRIHPVMRPGAIACSPECALALVDAANAKTERRQAKAVRAVDTERRESLKSRSDLIGEAQTAFNAFIRERDRQAGYLCISSGRPLDWSGNAVDAGHYRSRGSSPHLRFDERNCHAQSKHDNRYMSGNAVDYRIGLINRLGIKAVEELESDQTLRNWTHDDLRAIKATYKLKLKELQRRQSPDNYTDY